MKIKIPIGLCILLLTLMQCNRDTDTEQQKVPMLSNPNNIHIEAEWGVGVYEFAWYTKLVLSSTEQYIQTKGLKEKINIEVSKEKLLELYQSFFEEDFNTIAAPQGSQTALLGTNRILLKTKGSEGGENIETRLDLDMHAYLNPSKDYQRFDTVANFLKTWIDEELTQQKQTYTIKFDPQFLEKAQPFYFRIGDYYDSYENEELIKTGQITIDLLSGTNYYWIEWRKRPYLANKDGWIEIDAQQKELTFRLNNKGEVILSVKEY